METFYLIDTAKRTLGRKLAAPEGHPTKRNRRNGKRHHIRIEIQRDIPTIGQYWRYCVHHQEAAHFRFQAWRGETQMRVCGMIRFQSPQLDAGG
jgi:hypothetical protein